jgi:CDP-diacylglycerol--glycerol-3-phosphate 3-phosphatidyltransferase
MNLSARNLPNLLSLSRILVMPVFVALLLAPGWVAAEPSPLSIAWLHGLAFVVAVAVTVTDWLDGHLARKYGQITPLGKLLDPLADKVFVAGALVVLCELQIIPAWAVVIIIAREFLVTGLRSVAAESGQMIAADRLGKHKTGWQLSLILSAIFVSAVRGALEHAGRWDALAADYHANVVATALVWLPLGVALILTIASGWNYVAANRGILR